MGRLLQLSIFVISLHVWRWCHRYCTESPTEGCHLHPTSWQHYYSIWRHQMVAFSALLAMCFCWTWYVYVCVRVCVMSFTAEISMLLLHFTTESIWGVILFQWTSFSCVLLYGIKCVRLKIVPFKITKTDDTQSLTPTELFHCYNDSNFIVYVSRYSIQLFSPSCRTYASVNRVSTCSDHGLWPFRL